MPPKRAGSSWGEVSLSSLTGESIRRISPTFRASWKRVKSRFSSWTSVKIPQGVGIAHLPGVLEEGEVPLFFLDQRENPPGGRDFHRLGRRRPQPETGSRPVAEGTAEKQFPVPADAGGFPLLPDGADGAPAGVVYPQPLFPPEVPADLPQPPVPAVIEVVAEQKGPDIEFHHLNPLSPASRRTKFSAPGSAPPPPPSPRRGLPGSSGAG